MIYRIFNPCPQLHDIVDMYWYTKLVLNESILQDYPTPVMQGLTFNFSKLAEHHSDGTKTVTLYKEAYLFGQPVYPRIVQTHTSGIDILGVKFKPLGIAKVTGVNMEQFADRIIAAEDIWGTAVDSLCDEMQAADETEKAIAALERFLIQQSEKIKLHYRVDSVNAALSLLGNHPGTVTIKTLEDQTNTTKKTLERAFLTYLGMGPKLYSRILRFNAAMQALQQGRHADIGKLGLELGYYDGAHFSSEFKRFSGKSPTAFIKNGK